MRAPDAMATSYGRGESVLADGGLVVLFGNLAPKVRCEGSGVVPEMMEYEGPARIYESQEDALQGILAAK